MHINSQTCVGILPTPYGNLRYTYEDYIQLPPEVRIKIDLYTEYQEIEKSLDPGPMVTMSKAKYEHDLEMAFKRGRIQG